MQYLHKEQLVHGDLRGVSPRHHRPHLNLIVEHNVQANILIDEDLHVRLADFGVAVLADASSSSGISTRSGGAARWCPPEVLKGEPSSFESDIYAFGCVCVEVSVILLDLFNLQSFTEFSLFFQLYTLDRPFPEHNDAQVVAKVLKGIRPKRPSPET